MRRKRGARKEAPPRKEARPHKEAPPRKEARPHKEAPPRKESFNLADVLVSRKTGALTFRRNTKGQGTVEAAFLLPVLMLLFLMLLQPGIVLYDRIIMTNAAAEACRVLTTAQGDTQVVADYAKRRLGSIPPLPLFHVHEADCSWVITCEGGGASDVARVTIVNEVKPVPLLDMAGALMGLLNEKGHLEIKVSVEVPTRASWAQESLQGKTPEEAGGEWLE
jgi:hypothetical protein